MIKAFICRIIEWVLSPFAWVDEDREMGYVPSSTWDDTDEDKN